jgi:hypothetical protein
MFANTKVLAAIAIAGHPGRDYTCRTHQRRDIRGKGGAQESRAQATKRGHGKEASAAEKEEALLKSQCMFSLIMICEIHMFVNLDSVRTLLASLAKLDSGCPLHAFTCLPYRLQALPFGNTFRLALFRRRSEGQ